MSLNQTERENWSRSKGDDDIDVMDNINTDEANDIEGNNNGDNISGKVERITLKHSPDESSINYGVDDNDGNDASSGEEIRPFKLIRKSEESSDEENDSPISSPVPTEYLRLYAGKGHLIP